MRKLDNYAADMIPIRLIISISVVAAIVLIFSIGFINLRVNLAQSSIENDINFIESNLLNVIASGVARDVDEVDASDGTKRLISLSLPDNILFLSFGLDPDIDNDGVLNSGLFEDGANIFYQVQGGSKKVIWFDSEFRFREGNYSKNKWTLNSPEQGYIISSPGKYSIVFELVERFNEKYILIQSTDEFS